MKKAILMAAVALMAAAILVTPVLAAGPTKAAEVGNNPNLGLNPEGEPYMDNPSGSRRAWDSNSIVFWLYASNAKGIMNNALVADISTLRALGTDSEELNNVWIYLSGEHYGNTFNNPIDNPDVGSHGMFYWMLRGLGFPHAYALAVALDRAPDGFYFRMHSLGTLGD